MNILRNLILIVIILFCINISQAVYYENGTLEIEGESESSTSYSNFGSMVLDITATSMIMELWYKSEDLTGTPIRLSISDCSINYKGNFVDLPLGVGGPFMLYDGTTLVGTGNVFIYKQTDVAPPTCEADIIFYFDDNFVTGNDKKYNMYVYTNLIDVHYESFRVVSQATPAGYSTLNIGVLCPYDTVFGKFNTNLLIKYKKESTFKNEYSLKFDYSVLTSSITRVLPGYDTSSSYIIRNEDDSLYFESGYSTSNVDYISINDTRKFYLKPQSSGLEHLIYTNIYTPEGITDATLVFNQSTYNITDTMMFNYTNLEDLGSIGDTYDLQYYYYTSVDTIDYVYNVPLISPMENYNGGGYTNSYGWSPKKLYYGIINRNINLDSKVNFLANVRLTGYVNLTYPYEFIYDSCDGDYCQYTNGDTVVITYNVYSPYSIHILDSNDDTVQILDTVSGFGTINYVIPFDDSKQYDYPIWNMTVNSSYDNFMVYWVEQEEYEEYYQEDIEEEIQESIDKLKDGVKPLKDLLFGLTGIIVNNPDDDKNGIVDSDELDLWFNGLIPLLLVIVIFIIYKGLKER